MQNLKCIETRLSHEEQYNDRKLEQDMITMDEFDLLKCNVGKLFFVSDSSVARCVKLREYHDPGVEFMMRRYQDSLSPFFDVGANVGLFSFIAYELLGQTGQIVAFEPDLQNLQGLRENISIRHATNVDVVEKAVSSSNAPLSFGKIDCGVALKSKTNVIEIPCCTLDEYTVSVGIKPKFIKIDVEGAEADVVKGSENILAGLNTSVEMEFSYRDLHSHIPYLRSVFNSNDWDIECHLRHEESSVLSDQKNNFHSAHRAKHISTNQVFWPVVGKTDAQVDSLLNILKQSTEQDSSRKWELLFTPKTLTKAIIQEVREGFEVLEVN